MARTRSKSKKAVDTTPNVSRFDRDSTNSPTEQEPGDANTGRKRGATGWEAWEDRALAKQAQAAQPWATSKDEGGPAAAWNTVATTISCSNEKFKRNGLACQRRFKKLLEFHKNKEARDKQATGETAEIDEYVQIMTDVYNQMHDYLERKKSDNSNARAKILMEQKAGAELRDACMRGVVPRDTLCDITELNGSTSREKGGQRKGKKRARSSSLLSDTDVGVDVKPDPEPAPKKRKSVRQQLLDDIAASRKHTMDRIDAVQKVEAERADNLQDTLETIAGTMSTLSSAFVEDREERRKDHTNMMTIMAALATKQ